MNQVRPYLDSVGRFTVEQIPCPHFSQPVNLAGARTGVIHTTEGPHIDDALSVFKQHFAPHFLVGPGRILQLVQVGTIGAALVHHNPDAIVQIEVVGYSKQTPWIFDDATLEPLAALLAVIKAEYAVPLAHPWPDGEYGLHGDNPHRHAGKWGVEPGWYGHGDVPQPDEHWDPGALQWSKLFAASGALPDATSPAWTPPTPPARPCACHSSPYPIGSISWVQDKLGVPVDGIMGPFTSAKLKAFQSRAGITVDGIIGPQTIAALQKASS